MIGAIQFFRRGEDQLAFALLAKALATDCGHDYSGLNSRAGERPELTLARACLAARLNELASPRPDFSKIYRRIKRLLLDEKALQNQVAMSYLKKLRISLMHQTPREGTLEREVDDYLLAGGEHNSLGRYSTNLSVDEKKLIARGFEAIPVLLKLRHSQRLTGHIMPGFNNFPSHYLSVGRVVDSYIQSFANDEFADFLDVQKGYQPTDELIDKWWRQAQALGEEEYVRRYAIAIDGHGRARTSYPLVHLAKVKYPKFLIELFKRANGHDVDDTPILVAILEVFPICW